jgi:hypothetical protein
MTLYVANGVFSTFESGTGSDQLVVANGSFALFLSGTGGNTIYSGSVGRFSALCDLKQPATHLLPAIKVNVGRFSCSPGVKLSGTITFLKKHWSIRLSSGNSTADLIKPGLGYYGAIKSILQVGTFVSSGQGIKGILSRGDHIPTTQSLLVRLSDDTKQLLMVINNLAEVLKIIQKQSNSLSSESVVMVNQYLQSLSMADDIRATQKLAVSISDPVGQFKTLPVGIYIDGRPI